MYLIEPCCAQSHLRNVRNAIKKGGTTQFEGYGDLSLTELLGPMLTRYSETEMMIVAPSLPDQAAEVIDKWMRRQWSMRDGNGKLDVISHLIIVAKLERESSHYITAWLKDKPFGERLTLIEIEQDDTAILFPDFAITGPVNMRYGYHFEAMATTEPEKVAALWEKYRIIGAAPQNTETPTHQYIESNKAAKKKRKSKTRKL